MKGKIRKESFSILKRIVIELKLDSIHESKRRAVQ